MKKIINNKEENVKNNIDNRKKKKDKKKKIGIFSKEKESYSFDEVFSITIFSLLLGVLACFSVLTILNKGKNYFVLSKELAKFVDAYDAIVNNYYKEVDKDKLVESAINGMVSSIGDEYTSYSDKDVTDNFNEAVNGKYMGIGALIMKSENDLVIYKVFEDSPSYRAGLKDGDIILKLDDKDTKDMSVNDIASIVKNDGNKEVKLLVKRGEENLDITIVKDMVELPVVSGKVINHNDKKIGYISLSIFSSVASEQFNKELVKLEKEGISGLVIDVRGNSGGYLTTVTDIASYFLKKGDIIYKLEVNDKVTVRKDKTKESRDYPVAVLIDKNSASASEILASSIKESYNGYVVGTNSYGKGTVQQTLVLSDGSMIKYTIEKWLTPLGNWINEEGVIPTNYVELSSEYLNNPVFENDNQLNKALELVSK
ncbi:s41A subfamily peptidase [Clostridium sp. CAG:914]|nr:s41A subfamily peptidase [Clostridium sp. CAG:914]